MKNIWALILHIISIVKFFMISWNYLFYPIKLIAHFREAISQLIARRDVDWFVKVPYATT